MTLTAGEQWLIDCLKSIDRAAIDAHYTAHSIDRRVPPDMAFHFELSWIQRILKGVRLNPEKLSPIATCNIRSELGRIVGIGNSLNFSSVTHHFETDDMGYATRFSLFISPTPVKMDLRF